MTYVIVYVETWKREKDTIEGYARPRAVKGRIKVHVGDKVYDEWFDENKDRKLMFNKSYLSILAGSRPFFTVCYDVVRFIDISHEKEGGE